MIETGGLIVPLDVEIRQKDYYFLQLKLADYEDGAYVLNDKQIAIDFMVNVQSH